MKNSSWYHKEVGSSFLNVLSGHILWDLGNFPRMCYTVGVVLRKSKQL